jgi:cytochrome c
MNIVASIAAALLLLSAGGALAQDATVGEKVFNKCRACHQVGDMAKNLVGPKMNGIFGRKAGSVEGFKYSEANVKSGVSWDEASFAKYIKDPKAAMPGNKMAFPGIKNDKEIADLTAFLGQFDADGKKKN